MSSSCLADGRLNAPGTMHVVSFNLYGRSHEGLTELPLFPLAQRILPFTTSSWTLWPESSSPLIIRRQRGVLLLPFLLSLFDPVFCGCLRFLFLSRIPSRHLSPSQSPLTWVIHIHRYGSSRLSLIYFWLSFPAPSPWHLYITLLSFQSIFLTLSLFPPLVFL